MRAIVLVGGFGTRLRPLTLDTPKQMLPVVDRPMIDRVVAKLGEVGVTDAILSLGYRPDAFFDAYPDDTLRRREAALRRRARAARHRRRHPVRRHRGRHRLPLHRGQRRRPHRPRRRGAVGGARRTRRRGHHRPHPGRRSVPLRRRAPRRRRPGRGVHREAAAGRGAEQLDQRRHLRPRAVGGRAHPRRPHGLDRARDLPGDGHRLGALRPRRATPTGSTPAPPRPTCGASSTSSTAPGPARTRCRPTPTCPSRPPSSTRS